MAERATGVAVRTALRVTAIFLAGLNLRTLITSVPPVSQQIADQLGLNGVTVGLLITIPVLCLGLCAPIAPWLIRRLGAPTTVVVALVVLAVGLTSRLWAGQLGVLYAGTLVSGAGIGVLGAALPSAVRAWFPSRTGTGTGIYATAMAIGATISAGGTAQVSHLTGSWAIALAAWALPATVALLCWLPIMLDGRRPGTTRASATQAGVGISRWTVIAYFTCQSLQFFSQIALLPGTYREAGWSDHDSGLLLGAYNVGGIVATLLIPVLADKFRDRRSLLAVCTAVTTVALIAMTAVPTAMPWLTATTLGVAQTGGFVLGLALLAANAANLRATAKLAGTTFLISYPIAAAGPAVFGGLHDATGAYTAALVSLTVLGVLTLGLITCMRPSQAARRRRETGRPTTRITG